MTPYPGIIPRNRLVHLPKRFRAAHEYCFFLHDECCRILREYELSGAHEVSFKFENKDQAKKFKQSAGKDTITLLREIGKIDVAKNMIINHIKMALISDFCHHVYESLRSFEKRKSIVGFNLLRKPMKENLSYLTWILADPESFYLAFSSGQPESISQPRLGNEREALFKKAAEISNCSELIDAGDVHRNIFDKKYNDGFELLFQHAVHLVTVQNPIIKTSSENLNFIFKDPGDDDNYEFLYHHLPGIMLYATHVILYLMKGMSEPTEGAFEAALFRIKAGFLLLDKQSKKSVIAAFKELENEIECSFCKSSLKVSHYNAARMVLAESFRCSSCRKTNYFPLSWMI